MKKSIVMGWPLVAVLCVGTCLAQDAAHDVQKATSTTGGAVEHVGKKIGKETRHGVKAVGHGTSKGAQDTAHGAKTVAVKTANGAKDVTKQ